MSEPVTRSTSGTVGPWTAVLVDLDGTITDSAPVILDSLRRTFAELGLPAASDEQLMTFVGPPLNETFRAHGGLEGAQNARAVETYRRHYAEHLLDAPVYDGVPELLTWLRQAGVPVAVATSKREVFARAVLDDAGLTGLLTTVSGAGEDDATGGKADVIGRALERLAAAGADTSRPVHVGDRVHDVVGAHSAGIECVGVLWGYGDAEELADAERLVRTPEELRQVLSSGEAS